MTPPKILVITYFFNEQVGFDCYVRRIELMRNLGEVSVVCNKSNLQEKLHLADDEYIYLKEGEGSRLNYIWYLIKCVLFCWRFHPQTLVLLHLQLAPICYFYRKKCCAVLLWNIHPSQCFGNNVLNTPTWADRLKHKFNKFMKNFCYNSAKLYNFVMPVGEDLQRDLLDHGLASEKVKLIYMGVNDAFLPPFFEKPIYDGCPLQLLYTGSLNEERGGSVILKALALVNSPSSIAKLTIVGCSEACKKEVMVMATRAGILENVTIIGPVPAAKVPSYMHSADIGLNVWENNEYFSMNPPLKLFEYMVAGLPVIVSDCRSHSLYVENGVTGFIVKYDAAELAQKIKYLYDNRSLIQKMSLACRREGEKYRWSNLSEKMEKMFG